MKKHWFLPEKEREEYLKVCREAFENDDKFSNFRREPIYQMIVDNGNEEGALRLQKYIESHYPHLLDHKFKNIDDYGNPVTYEFNKEKYSNSKVRYLKIIGEIEEYLNTDFENVFEIGGGFGGFAYMFFEYFLPQSYNIFDLEEVGYLQHKFVKNLDPWMNIYFSDSIYKLNSCDLIISICSYSELSRKLQDEYIDKVISKANYGYFHLNNGIEEQANYLRSRLKNKEIITRDIFINEPINQSIFMFKPKK